MNPMSAEQFFDVFRAYNEAIWPMQIVLVIGALLAAMRAIAGDRKHAGPPTTESDRLVGLILTVLWVWTGLAYFFTFFAPVNGAAWLFGALFLAQAGLFAHATLRHRLSFRAHLDGFGIVGAALLLYALLIYPLLAKLTGHGYPFTPTFGAPCPTTIFTFALLLWVTGRVPAHLLVIPALWSIVGLSAVWNYGVVADVGLGVAGVVGTTMIVMRNRRMDAAGRSRAVLNSAQIDPLTGVR
jgi:hypothetical protein